jgi:hypothetical protein
MRMRWKWNVAHMSEKRNACRNLIRKPEENIPPGRPRHGQVNTIKIDLK